MLGLTLALLALLAVAPAMTSQIRSRGGSAGTDGVGETEGPPFLVSAGTSYFMDLAKAIDDQWMPTKAETVIKMRSLLVMKTNEKYTAEYGNYRKFTTDVLIRVVGPEN